jgi:hypothetical protein
MGSWSWKISVSLADPFKKLGRPKMSLEAQVEDPLWSFEGKLNARRPTL